MRKTNVTGNLSIVVVLVKFYNDGVVGSGLQAVTFAIISSTLISSSVAAPRLWNSLPLSCRTAPSVNILKNRLKTFLFSL